MYTSLGIALFWTTWEWQKTCFFFSPNVNFQQLLRLESGEVGMKWPFGICSFSSFLFAKARVGQLYLLLWSNVVCTVGGKFVLFLDWEKITLKLQTSNTWALCRWNLEANCIYSQRPLRPPQRRWKIPPELTNRYVKNEAFIVVVFDNILTLLLTKGITILWDCYCCCFQVRILTRLTLLSLRTLLPIVSVATHLPTAFQYFNI